MIIIDTPDFFLALTLKKSQNNEDLLHMVFSYWLVQFFLKYLSALLDILEQEMHLTHNVMTGPCKYLICEALFSSAVVRDTTC